MGGGFERATGGGEEFCFMVNEGFYKLSGYATM